MARFVVVLSAMAVAQAIRVGEVSQFKSQLRQLIPAKGVMTAKGDRADLIGGLVRLGFHDAGTHERYMPCGKRSGPDGCLPLTSDSNKGLGPIVELLDDLCSDFKSSSNLSRADCWQLASLTALEEAAPRDAGLAIPFFWGRFDRDDCSSTTSLPAGDGGTQSVLNMAARMQVSISEIVALSGGHSVGRAETINSGFPANGFAKLAWTQEPGLFDNGYFKNILNTRWDLGDPTLGAVFSPDRSTFMLRSDVALVYNISSSGADSVCLPHDPELYPVLPAAVPPACPVQLPSSMAGWVRKYADSREEFYTHFVSGWLKLSSLGYTGLREPCPDEGQCDPPPIELCMTPDGIKDSPVNRSCEASPLTTEAGQGKLYDCQYEFSEGGAMHWTEEDADAGTGTPKRLLLALRVRGTGWASFGFPETLGVMSPAKLLIGWGGMNAGADVYDAVGRNVQKDNGDGPLGLQEHSVEQTSGWTTLRSTFKVCDDTVQGSCLDATKELKLNIARHSTENALVQHDTVWAVSLALSGLSQEFSVPSHQNARRIHAALMTAAWVFLGPLAVFFKRFGKPVFLLNISSNARHSYKLYIFHVAPAVLGVILCAAGLIVAAKNWWTIGKVSATAHTSHSVVGTLLMVWMLFQPITGVLLTPRYDSRHRYIFHVVHAVIGKGLVVVCFVQCVMGLVNLEELDPSPVAIEITIVVGITFWTAAFLICTIIKKFFYVRSVRGQETGMQDFIVSLGHVRLHNKESDCWVIVLNKVYDVTQWVPEHPGGSMLIMQLAGKDASVAFERARHSDAARLKLRQCYCADLEDERADNCVRLVHGVTKSLVNMHVDEAEDTVHKALTNIDVPDVLCEALLRHIENLREYKDFLPVSMLVHPHKELSFASSINKGAIAFVDVCGSDALWEGAPLETEVALDLYANVLRSCCVLNAGMEVRLLGSTGAFVFSNTERACFFGVMLQEDLERQHWPRNEWMDECQNFAPIVHKGTTIMKRGLRVKVSINYGELDAYSSMDGATDFHGNTVRAAAKGLEYACSGMTIITDKVKAKMGQAEVEFTCNHYLTSDLDDDAVQFYYLVSSQIAERESHYIREAPTNGRTPPRTPLTPGGGSRFASVSAADPKAFFETTQEDAVLRYRSRSQLSQYSGTIAVLNLMSTQQVASKSCAEVMTACSTFLSKTAEAAARSNGKVLGASAAEVSIAWNVVSPCPTHQVRCQFFVHFMKDTGFGTQIGTASGLIFHGHIPAGRQRFQGLLGPAVDLARRAARMCSSFGTQALCVFMPKTPKALIHSLRPLDLWSFGGILLSVEEPLTLSVKEGKMLDWKDESDSEKSVEGTPHEGSVFFPKYREAFFGAAAGDPDQAALLSEMANTADKDSSLATAVQLLSTYAKPAGPGYRIMIADDNATAALKALNTVRDLHAAENALLSPVDGSSPVQLDSGRYSSNPTNVNPLDPENFKLGASVGLASGSGREVEKQP
eukprot:Hpha_TRINITY_DN14142_c1_g1::TRINITY_DN14142_c1_g1_i1::g.11148::m.11148